LPEIALVFLSSTGIARIHLGLGAAGIAGIHRGFSGTGVTRIGLGAAGIAGIHRGFSGTGVTRIGLGAAGIAGIHRGFSGTGVTRILVRHGLRDPNRHSECHHKGQYCDQGYYSFHDETPLYYMRYVKS
jgi:hypothetical protein